LAQLAKGHFFNRMSIVFVQYGIAWREVGNSMGLDIEIIYIVDDDPIVRDALSSLLRSNGKTVRLFTSGTEFLSFTRDDTAACLILDLKMPGMGGLEVQKVVSAQTSIPIVFITGRGDIPSTVKAMKGGAVDFLTKPVDEAVLLAAVEKALQKDRVARCEALEQAELVARYRSLTPREQELLPLLVRGLLNKQAAAELGITEYTVQIHRGNITRKMKADSFASLVRLATKLGVEPSLRMAGIINAPVSMTVEGLQTDSLKGVIAVIDDDHRVRESLQNLLASYGYRAETYSSAELFLESDGLTQSNCIIADVEMRRRRMTGLELLNHVRGGDHEVAVIIITGKPSAKSEAFYRGEGASGFFRKPLDGQALVTLIDHLLS
jgi:FixJ family two-component response regulator